MNNAYCMCTTSGGYHSYINNWDDFILTGTKLEKIVDITTDPSFHIGFTYTEDDIRKNLNFNLNVSKRNFWNQQGNRNIIWFYAYLRMLNFYISNPDYDNYWFFDDDIKMDNWGEFLDGVKTDDIDFISYFVFKNNDVESQILVPKINNKSHSGLGWFNRFPGDGDMLPTNITEMFGSFFPIVKFSNKAMKKLLEINNQGFSGYGEGFVPTILNQYGMKIGTLIETDNTSKYFDVDVVNIEHKNSKIGWEWI